MLSILAPIVSGLNGCRLSHPARKTMKLKVGELYMVRDINSIFITARSPTWRNAPVLYLGEDVIERDDGVRIVNHVVLVKGEKRLLDRTFLKFLKPLTTS